jgi:hypothetical protein
MRLLFISLLFLPATVGAETLADTHFTGSFCWERTYDQDHLANHPEQQTTRFAIGREPSGHPSAPGEIPMELRVRVRGESEELTAVGYCDPDEDRFRCGLEGDAGLYMIEAQGPDNVLVTVGERPMLIEGSVRNHEFRSDGGDDRAFLLRRCG